MYLRERTFPDSVMFVTFCSIYYGSSTFVGQAKTDRTMSSVPQIEALQALEPAEAAHQSVGIRSDWDGVCRDVHVQNDDSCCIHNYEERTTAMRVQLLGTSHFEGGDIAGTFSKKTNCFLKLWTLHAGKLCLFLFDPQADACDICVG